MTRFVLVLLAGMTALSFRNSAKAGQEHGTHVVVLHAEARPDGASHGHRFRLIADVDGNGRADTLTERFVDPSTDKETDKFIADASYDSLAARVWRMAPISFVECSDKSVGRLGIRVGPSFGLAHFVNEGDLNGDGRDELGWVGHWADFSNLNTYHITSWNGSEWVELASFGMWEWQLPDLTGSAREFGFIGQTGLYVSDSIAIDEPAADLVWPGKHGQIHVLGMAEGAELDTLTLTLAPLKP